MEKSKRTDYLHAQDFGVSATQTALCPSASQQFSKEHLSPEVLPVCLTHLSSLNCSTGYSFQCTSQSVL